MKSGNIFIIGILVQLINNILFIIIKQFKKQSCKKKYYPTKKYLSIMIIHTSSFDQFITHPDYSPD